MIRKLANVDFQFKGIVGNIDIMVYMNCDQSAQDILKHAQRNLLLNLEEKEDEEDRRELI